MPVQTAGPDCIGEIRQLYEQLKSGRIDWEEVKKKSVVQSVVVIMLPVLFLAFLTVTVRGQSCQAGGNCPNQIQHNIWGYHEDAGPGFWATRWNFPTCAGRRQSPVNIVENNTVYDERLTPIHFDGYDQQPLETKLINTGASIVMRVTTPSVIDVTGGVLDGEYIFDHLHFHWGSNDKLGSEHFIDNAPTPMEIHFVHYHSKYPGVKEALGDPKGLAVLGFLFELSEKDNEALELMLPALKYVMYKGQSTTMLPFPIGKFLPRPGHMREYFRYDGSLTTPPCSEAVIWTVFEEEIPISRRQLDILRQIYDDDDDGTDHAHELMSDNFRPPQPLNSRTIYRSFPHLTALY